MSADRGWGSDDERPVRRDSLLTGDRWLCETLDHLLEGCQILGLDYRYLYINDAAEQHNRRPKSELIGRVYMEMWPGIEDTEVFRLIRDCMERRRRHTIEYHFTFPDGSVGDFELRIQPVPDGVFILSLNISDRRNAEREGELLRKRLMQAQTMEAVGRLSGGLAHDFNNMLSVILSQAELVLEELGPQHPLVDDLERIREAARRSADLTGQLLAFARRQTATPQVLDLNQAISKLLDMLERLIGENIALSFQPGEALWLLRIDPSQVDQLLVNLCVNARDAIADTGHITLSCTNVRLGGGAEAAGGDYVRLSVSDDGKGMSPDVQERMFEPFFTTKGQGKGTGLGLATVYGVVKQNRGNIHVRSEVGRGTRIDIDLPRHHAQEPSLRPAREPRPLPALERGVETILIVEDEPVILHVTQRVVRAFGYRVLAASSARAALALLESHAGPIDLLLTDVVMPEMNGRELAERVRAKRPEIVVLFTSGYTDDVIAHHGVLERGVEFLQKPYPRAALASRLRELLDRRLVSAAPAS
jgi:signal transduction histidine kinase/ActR/RegA family two-component response regulator